jgi:hypothetical protein
VAKGIGVTLAVGDALELALGDETGMEAGGIEAIGLPVTPAGMSTSRMMRTPSAYPPPTATATTAIAITSAER